MPIINGTPDADIIDGTSVDDTILGGGGDDWLRGQYGSDTYVYAAGDGNDAIADIGAESDVDTLWLTNLSEADVTLSRSFDHLLVTVNATGEVVTVGGQFADPTVFGDVPVGATIGIEQIRFADGTTLDRSQFEWLRGTPGADVVDGRFTDDTILGSGGDDILFGREGSDTYVYAAGDGNDDIVDIGPGSDVDTLWLTNLNAADVTLSRSFDHLLVTVNRTGEVVTVRGQFADPSTLVGEVPPGQTVGIEQIRFADGTILDRLQIAQAGWLRGTPGADFIEGTAGNDTISGGAGDDSLIGSAGSDTYLYAAGDGNDVLSDTGSGSDVDTLWLTNLNAADITLGRSIFNPIDLLVTVNATGEAITVGGQFSSADIGLEQIRFADGTSLDRSQIAQAAWLRGTPDADWISGTPGDDTFVGGGGDDVQDGSDGSDTYIYAAGDGNDVITDFGSESDVDTLRLPNLNAADVTLSRSPDNHLLVTVNATGEVVTVASQFFAMGGIEQLQFADGTSLDRSQIEQMAWLRGTPDADIVSGTDGNDIIVGGGGDDALFGNRGSDTYVYAAGDGNDAILDSGLESDVDTLRLTNLNAADVTLTRSIDSPNTLLVRGNTTGEVITVHGQFFGTDGLEQIQLGDGTSLDRSQIEQMAWLRGTPDADIVDGTGGNDTIVGGGGDDVQDGGGGSDTYVYAAGDGNDAILDAGPESDVDTLRLTNLNAADVTLTRSIDSPITLLVRVNTTGEVITVDGQFFGTNGLEQIQFGDGTSLDRSQIEQMAWLRGTPDADIVDGTGGNDTIVGGGGDDVQDGGGGSDTYIYAAGDGNDAILDAGPESDVDTLRLTNLNAADVTLTRSIDSPNTLLVRVNTTGEVITVHGQFFGTDGLEQIQFGDGTSLDRSQIEQMAWLRGTPDADIVDGTGGNDTIVGGGGDVQDGGGGSDTYVYAAGDGNDVILDSGADSYVDTLWLTNLNAADVTLT